MEDSIFKKGGYNKQQKNFIRTNERIRVKEVRVVGADGEQLGVLPTPEALQKAQDLDLDLVEVAPTATPPVCRIMDYSKYKYEQQKKERRIKKNQSVTHLKQIRIKPRIGEGDLQIKIKHAIEFLQKKDKVKINMMFRGREIAHKDIGREIIDRVVEDLKEFGQPEAPPKLEGRTMAVVLAPISDK